MPPAKPAAKPDEQEKAPDSGLEPQNPPESHPVSEDHALGQDSLNVIMRVQLSGTRNGDDWPKPGTTVTLPKDEAHSMIANGLAALPAVETATVTAPVETATVPAKASIKDQESAD